MLQNRTNLSSTCNLMEADDPWKPLSWESPIDKASSHTSGSVCPNPSSAGPSLTADTMAVESLAAGWLPAAGPPAEPVVIGQKQVQQFAIL